MKKLNFTKLAVVLVAICCASSNLNAETKPLKSIRANEFVVTSESDPTFANWLTGRTFLESESDPTFTSWLGGVDFNFNGNGTPAGTFKINPVGGSKGFYIGTNTLYELFQMENDPVFDSFKKSSDNISIGYKSSGSTTNSVAIGMPGINAPSGYTYYPYTAGTGVTYFWRLDWLGPTYADRESVALGDAAQARFPVSVAIGDQAIVGALHTDTEPQHPVMFDKREIITTISGGDTTVTTNITHNFATNYYWGSRYERLPSPEWMKLRTATNETSGVTTITEYWEQREAGGLYDISYLSPDEWNYYNRTVDGGQGAVNITDGYYGVAIGSRAYVFGYHGIALGHYAHVSRPWAMAIGSEAHVYSEGAQGIGYDVDISTNAPYSLAVGAYGTVTPGMTNAIVVGVPQIRMKDGIMSVTKRPTAVKNNSINFAYNGNGIQDFFLDGVSLQDRLASEVKVVGNTKEGTKPDEVDQAIRAIGNIPDDEDPLVFYSGDGGIYFFTKEYEEDSERHVGDISKIFINGKPLSEIIEGSSSHDADFSAYKTTVSNAAERAMAEVNAATNMTGVKAALTNFFNTIKQ